MDDELEQKPEKEIQQQKKSAKPLKSKKRYTWPIKAFFLTLILSSLFSVFSEIVINSAESLIIYITLVFALICVNVFFDIIGMAFAVCDITPFYSMASKKIRGAKVSLTLLKKAEVVSSVCGDVIGDICGIVSGVAAAAIVLKFIESLSVTDNIMKIVITTAISAVVAAITITAKAFAKRFAMLKSFMVVDRVGKFFSLFVRNK